MTPAEGCFASQECSGAVVATIHGDRGSVNLCGRHLLEFAEQYRPLLDERDAMVERGVPMVMANRFINNRIQNGE